MAQVSRFVRATPQRVFDELADGWIYTSWVVGASHIRDVDDTWPQIGAQLHHKVGAWPLLISDSTQVLDVGEPYRLVLQARLWPLGEARVELTLVTEGDGTRVTLDEEPVKGPGKWLHTPIQDAVLRARNAESLDRLATLVEKRPDPSQR